jgi:hypothetical protein
MSRGIDRESDNWDRSVAKEGCAGEMSSVREGEGDIVLMDEPK